MTNAGAPRLQSWGHNDLNTKLLCTAKIIPDEQRGMSHPMIDQPFATRIHAFHRRVRRLIIAIILSAPAMALVFMAISNILSIEPGLWIVFGPAPCIFGLFYISFMHPRWRREFFEARANLDDSELSHAFGIEQDDPDSLKPLAVIEETTGIPRGKLRPDDPLSCFSAGPDLEGWLDTDFNHILHDSLEMHSWDPSRFSAESITTVAGLVSAWIANGSPGCGQ